MKMISERTLYKGKWLQLKELIFSGKNGQELKWEAVERVNEYGVIVIMARLIPSNRMIFIKQYRPAIDNYVIGFPAGIAENPDIANEALRELEEETGYRGSIISVSPPLKSNPALINDKVYVVHVEVNETDAVNQNPVQLLEPSEDIEVITVGEDMIPGFFTEQIQKGYEIGVGPWYAFAL